MSTERLPRPVQLAFAPIHKRALGVACGVALGGTICLATLLGVALRVPPRGTSLQLLSEYFAGYTVTPVGALVGLAWGFATGFIFGWFLAFMRNFMLAASMFWLRTREELNATRDFLDHI